MSWKMTNEVRQERLAGRLPNINFADFAVLFIMADTCRGESRNASLSMSELVKLSGQERTSMWRAINKLVALRYLRKVSRGNQFQASSYEVLPEARCADATSNGADERCTGATSNGQARCADATSNGAEHVALTHEHVAFEPGARCADATHPVDPDNYPEEGATDSGTSPDEPAAAPTRATQQLSNGKRPRCARHAHILDDARVPSCLDCRDIRLADEAEQEQDRQRRDAERAAIRRAIDHCKDCDQVGRLDDLSDCPKHPNFRRSAAGATR